MDDMPELAARTVAAARDARRALVLTVMAALVAGVVLAIDAGIKRAVLDEVARAHAILADFRAAARDVEKGNADGTTAPRGRAGASAGLHSPDDMVPDAGAGTVLAQAPRAGHGAPGRRETGGEPGPGRHGA